MNKNTKMHAEYRVEYCGGDDKWRPLSFFAQDSPENVKGLLEQAEIFYPARYGWKHRIVVRLVGDWCEMKEEKMK